MKQRQKVENATVDVIALAATHLPGQLSLYNLPCLIALSTPPVLCSSILELNPRNRHYKMPLIVPGVTADNLGDSQTQEWMMKLMGKTLTDGSSNETVGFCVSVHVFSSRRPLLTSQAFSKKDLPAKARIVQPGQIMSRDHEPERLNVVLSQDGTVENVYHG